jgi:hypothetical protein
MYDLTVRQLDERIADYHRMMARVNGPACITTPPRRPGRVREAVARALLSLATRLARVRPESRTA